MGHPDFQILLCAEKFRHVKCWELHISLCPSSRRLSMLVVITLLHLVPFHLFTAVRRRLLLWSAPFGIEPLLLTLSVDDVVISLDEDTFACRRCIRSRWCESSAAAAAAAD